MKRAAPTAVLLEGGEPIQRAELHWRLAAPPVGPGAEPAGAAAVAGGAARGRYTKLLIAVLCYLICVNCPGLGRVWISQGKLDPRFGFWWARAGRADCPVLLWRSQ